MPIAITTTMVDTIATVVIEDGMAVMGGLTSHRSARAAILRDEVNGR
jgi:hypothetical protein